MFTLDMLNAAQGDALVVTYGDSPGHRILIDGGPKDIYACVIKQFFAQLGTPAPIDLMVVTHVDDDHIHGILDLATDQVRKVEDRTELTCEIAECWFNTFDTVTSQVKIEQLDQAPAAGPLATRLAGLLEAYTPGEKGILLESIKQGDQLNNAATKLGWEMNPGFTNNLVLSGAVRKLPGGMKVTILNPRAAELEVVRKQWAKYYQDKRNKPHEAVKPVAFMNDDNPFNLSSIAFLLEYDGKTMLMTGDARGDEIIAGLQEANRLTNGKIHVDLLKLPHHGSKANIDAAFFSTVIAKNYAISANGMYGNPDPPTLKLLSDARKDDDFAVYLTNTVPHAEAFFKKEKDNGRKYRVYTRENGRLSIQIAL